MVLHNYSVFILTEYRSLKNNDNSFPYLFKKIVFPVNSTVSGPTPLVFVSTKWKGRFALWLCHFTGQKHKGFDKSASVNHRHFPQTDFLILGPVLRHV